VLNEYHREFSSTFGENLETGNSLLIFDDSESTSELAYTR
jgi:hypothetical protein